MDKLVKKPNFEGKDVDVLVPEYEAGQPVEKNPWRNRMTDRKQMMNYLKTAERYWYAEEGYGSEKRKNPA